MSRPISSARSLFRRLSGIVPSQQREQEFAAELDSHLQMHTDDNLRAGLPPAEARRQAILTLGGVEATRQSYRNQRTIPLIEHTLQDIRFGARQLLKNPGFAATAILMLALGISASVSIFAFVDAALIKPLPYPNPTRLVNVTESMSMFPRANLSYPDYLDWKRLNTVFASMAIFDGTGYMLPTGTGPELVPGTRVSDGFFHTLGITPILGRDFYSGEDLPSAPHTVILSYAAWQHRFADSKTVLGQTVVLSGTPYTIVGVLPRNFQFALRSASEFYAPLHPGGGCDLRRSCHSLNGIGRLKDGVTVQQALANMTQIAANLERQYPDSNRGQGASVEPLAAVIVGDVRPILLTLLAGAALLLLIACVNIASLLLVRSESRRREMAVRGALGASRGRLIRQFVTEGLLLVTLGSALGIAAAAGAMHLLLHLLSKDMLLRMPYLDGLSLNPRVLAFALAVAVLAAILFSATPLLRLSMGQMREGLAEGSRGSAGVLWRRLGSNLVVAELAIAMVLLVAAALLGKSFYRLLHVSLGFQPDHLATMQVVTPPLSYATDEQQAIVARKVIDQISTVPGVQSVATSSLLPISGNGNTDWIRFAGRFYDGHHNEVNERDISPAFFTTLQATLIRGRYFTPDDDASKLRVAIINQSLAKKYFPGEDPIGKIYGDTALSPKSLRQIVGIVEDLREATLDSENWPTEYLPFAQSPDTAFNLVVRTTQPEQTVLPAIARAVHQVDPGIATLDDSTMQTRIDDSPTAALHRSSAALVGGFAALALLLGVAGLYGVIAYSVSQRTREIGVRMALGAQRATVYRLILREAGWLTGCGISAGAVCAIAAAMLMRGLLFGIAAWDAATLLSVALVLALAAIFASFIPAHRAASINPTEALRAE